MAASTRNSTPVVGIDFDNTLVTYDRFMYAAAIERGLIDSKVEATKREIRDAVRRLPGGEEEWQKLQGLAYGPRMDEARLIEGVQSFFESCKKSNVAVYIVSHKTHYANYDPTATNLRETSLAWMTNNRFFETDGLGLLPEDVFFESTRREKIDRIRYLGCTHFIDDLEETFLEDSFPAEVEKILFSPGSSTSPVPEITLFGGWTDITDYFFRDARSQAQIPDREKS